MSTGRTSRRPAWVEALGGVAGFALGLGWVLGYGAVLRWIDGIGFSWPLPGPLAWAAFIAIVTLTWVPWAPVLGGSASGGGTSWSPVRSRRSG